MNTDSPAIAHRETATGGEFTIGQEAVMTYQQAAADRIIVDHTEVARQSEGKGLAGRLYRHMVSFARERNLKVTPACSYVVAMFKRYPEDGDVLN